MLSLKTLILTAGLMTPAAGLVTAQQDSSLPAAEFIETEPVVSDLNITETIARANESLNAIDTVRGRFMQRDFRDQITTGSFYLNRPGRMRFEYDAPSPILLISDGAMVAIEDRDLETVDAVPLSQTPLNLILRPNTDLARFANILAVERKGGYISLRVSDKTEETQGELDLFFDPETFELKQWQSIDANGAVTTVQLFSAEYDVRIPARLFRIEDPEDEDDRRR